MHPQHTHNHQVPYNQLNHFDDTVPEDLFQSLNFYMPRIGDTAIIVS